MQYYSIRVCLICVTWRFSVVLSRARQGGEAVPVPVTWPAPAFITVKPLLSGPPIKRTPCIKRTLSRVLKRTS